MTIRPGSRAKLLETLRDAFVQAAGGGRVPYARTSEERARLLQLAEGACKVKLTRP